MVSTPSASIYPSDSSGIPVFATNAKIAKHIVRDPPDKIGELIQLAIFHKSFLLSLNGLR
jgi:hypothetical protein